MKNINNAESNKDMGTVENMNILLIKEKDIKIKDNNFKRLRNCSYPNFFPLVVRFCLI